MSTVGFYEARIRKSQCSICLMTSGPQVATPCCEQSFHLKCIVKWTVYKPTCPCCRSNFPSWFTNGYHVELEESIKQLREIVNLQQCRINLLEAQVSALAVFISGPITGSYPT